MQKPSATVTQPMRIDLGDHVRLRKQHACGGDVWEVVRIGMDIRIKCLNCGRSVLLPRSQFEKQVKEFVKTTSQLG
jgi:hypothetical protein